MSTRVKIFSRVDGPDSAAPWIVLSNSLAADHTMWDAQIPLLIKRFRVLRYDTRGHGASDVPLGPYSFEDLIGDVVALMDSQGIERASFMGLSLGGMTGVGLAISHPERVSRLLCCDARVDSPAEFRKGWDDRSAIVRTKGMAGIVHATVERWLASPFRAAHPAVVARITDMILRTPTEGWLGCASAIRTIDYLGQLPRLAVETLYVVGEHDTGAPPDVMRAMAAATPGACMNVIPNAAHLPNIDAAAEFNALIGRFLGMDDKPA
jgi:3-oxoadipate enol-lactonase